MKNSYYWNYESWGNAYLPENVDNVIETANNRIDQYIKLNKIDSETESHVIEHFSEWLWDAYCRTENYFSEKSFSEYLKAMDNDLRDYVAFDLPFYTEWEFMSEYLELHYQKFGKEFIA